MADKRRCRPRLYYGCVGVALALALSGCGKEAAESFTETSQIEEGVKEESKQTEEDISSEGIDAGEKETQEGETASQTVETKDLEQLHISISYEYLSEWSDGKAILSAQSPKFYVLNQGYEELQAALDSYSQKEFTQLEEIYQEELPYAMEYQREEETSPYINHFAYMKRSDEAIVSFAQSEESYMTGAAHPGHDIRGVNLDPRTGEFLDLKDVIADYDGLYEYTAAYLKEHYDPAVYFEEYEETLRQMFYGEDQSSIEWTMDRSGLTLYFNTYVLAPYAAGGQEVLVSFEACEHLFQKEYVVKDQAMSIKMMEGMAERVDVNGDGWKDELLLTVEKNEDPYRFEYLLTITCNGTALKMEQYGGFSDAYLLISEAGNGCLYVETATENDYRHLDLFTFRDGTPSHVETTGKSFLNQPPVNPEDFLLYERLDVLGTYIGWQKCTIMDDGTFEITDPVYEIINYDSGYGEYTVTALREIQGIPAGTKCTPRRTDGKSFVEMELDDGTYRRVFVSPKEDEMWGWNVDGVDEYQSFDGIRYVG